MKVGAIAPADGTVTETQVDFSALTDGANFPNAVYSAIVSSEDNTDAISAQVKTLNLEDLYITHTAGATLLHYVVYGR